MKVSKTKTMSSDITPVILNQIRIENVPEYMYLGYKIKIGEGTR